MRGFIRMRECEGWFCQFNVKWRCLVFFSFFTGKANQNSFRWLILLTFRGPQSSFKLFVDSLWKNYNFRWLLHKLIFFLNKEVNLVITTKPAFNVIIFACFEAIISIHWIAIAYSMHIHFSHNKVRGFNRMRESEVSFFQFHCLKKDWVFFVCFSLERQVQFWVCVCLNWL